MIVQNEKKWNNLLSTISRKDNNQNKPTNTQMIEIFVMSVMLSQTSFTCYSAIIGSTYALSSRYGHRTKSTIKTWIGITFIWHNEIIWNQNCSLTSWQHIWQLFSGIVFSMILCNLCRWMKFSSYKMLCQ